MKSAVETLNPTRVKLTVEVPFDELKPSLDAAYKTIASQINIPGFRRGKVPPRIIDQRVGRGAVIEEAVNEALPMLYSRAVEESSLRPLGQPTVDITSVPDAPGSQLTFTAEVDVRPDITLPDLAGIAVTVDDVSVSDEDVQRQLDQLRERFGTLLPEDKAAEDGDFVSIDLTAVVDGEEIDSVKNISYQIGSGTMLAGLDEALTGLSAGETTTFTSPLPGGEHKGEEAVVTVTVQAVKTRSLPNLDDDFASLASEFDSLEELTADVRSQVERGKAMEQGIQARDRLLEHLLDSVEVPVPDGVVAEQVHQHLEGEGRLEDDEHRAEVEAESRKAVASQLLLDAIVEKLEVQVSQQEFVEYVVAASQQFGMDPNTFVKTMEEAGQISGMVGEVARRKALAAVLEKASVTDTTGAAVDLEAVRGSERDPIAEIEEAIEQLETGAPADDAANESADATEAAADDKDAS